MLPINKVLIRIIVTEFYKQNLGLFLFVFFIMFGMVEGSQLIYYHLSLITGVIQSTAFFSLVLTLWLVYAIKSAQFVTSQLAKPQHSFLFVLTSLPKFAQVFAFALVHVLIHTPVLLYAIAIATVAFDQGQWLLSTEVIVFNLLLCGILCLISVHKLNHPSAFSNVTFFKLPRFIKKSLAWFYAAFLLNELKVITTVTKLFSYFAVYGFLQISVDHYENRIALMGLLVGLTGHAVLIFELRKWEDSYLHFLKNLPFSPITRYLTMVIIFSLLLLPELFLLLTHHVKLIDLIGSLLFSISFLLLLFAMVHHLKMDMDKYIQYLLILFLISFGIVLFKLYWVLILLYLFTSFSWYKKYFYTYESLRL